MGIHGRGWWPRLAMSALMVLLAAATVSSQLALQLTAPSLDEEFTDKLVAALPSATPVRLFCPSDDRLQADLARRLSTRGFKVVDGAVGATPVQCSCQDNLKERVCIADIGEGPARHVVVATRDLLGATARDPVVALELRPVYAQRDPILDVVPAEGGWLVLTPTLLKLIPAQPEATTAPLTRVVTTARVWPRDLRGRLRTTPTGFEAFLPGVTCRGSVTPFTLACADDGDAWPVGIDNAGIAPSRNVFTTPEGMLFYEAAPIGPQGWVVVDRQRTLAFLDKDRRAVASGDAADHAAALRSPCSSERYVATAASSTDADAVDVVRLSRVSEQKLVPESSTAPLPGQLTALWPWPDERAATAVVHDVRSGRYEAFHLGLSCTR